MASSAEMLPDIAWIDPGQLAVGSRPYASQRAQVAALGIRTVITLHDPNSEEASAWDILGVRLVAMPTHDWVAIPANRFDEVVDAVEREIAAGRPVLLHCLAGVNRAPTAAAAVLVKRDGLTADAAVAAVRARRPAAAPTPEQMASLTAWARRQGRSNAGEHGRRA